MQKLILGGAAAVLGAGVLLYRFRRNGGTNTNTIKGGVNVDDLETIVGKDAARVLALDTTWLELVDRLGEFALFAKSEYKDVVSAVAGVVAFQTSLSLKKIKHTFATPRKYRARLHAVIEAVRCMRAQIELESPSCLEDFDEIAADVQTTHNDYNSNMYFNSVYDK